uniref:RNA polymerase sigma factor 70 region 4 type 2 domain-containing protein n=1 Tax=uncultured Armatimonadetes bacterium TaxID=157466 RepID=A0A6J4JHL6_9BACT|nr:hypothetical protein AVDCRST_MAG63-3368 [uncultured Armatimonadetes bacterium]
MLPPAAADAPPDHAQRLVVRDALRRLPPAQRLTFSLFHIGGYAHAEIAALLDVPVNTVRSRLQTARRLLRADLQALYSERKTTMSSPARTEPAAARVARDPLPPSYETLIRSAFPEARIVSAERRPETWMPFYWRSRLALPDGTERSVDVRAFASILGSTSVGRAEAALLGVLKRQGLPVPELLAGPLPDPENPQGGNPVALTAAPAGENLLLWALESNLPHRVRAATALAIEAIDRLHGLTDALLADPVGASLPRRPLLLDLSEIAERGGPWMDDPLFAGAVRRLTPLVQEISEATPLVYTNDLYLPNFLRAAADTDGFDVKAPFGWPGDPRASDLQITEFVIPFGWLGDPLLGLAKFWTYDCYPFVHTGFVERYLYERGITRRDFAPRLAVRALWTLQRELPVSRPAEGPEYWDSLVGLLKHALQSLD